MLPNLKNILTASHKYSIRQRGGFHLPAQSVQQQQQQNTVAAALCIKQNLYISRQNLVSVSWYKIWSKSFKAI